MSFFVFFLLLVCVAVVSADSQTDFNLLFAAAESNKPQTIATLIAGNAAIINNQGTGGQTPLMAAVLAGSLEAADMLLQLGADPLIGEVDGYTPMHAAAFEGFALPSPFSVQ
jgi:serine/threonine-protein kinase TNNI3K